ncbi:type I-D CRISPR-associated protein Cas5/Csc1 [uncultured Microscilla sp.]|uniref:type I-D CRISPR-associated protein Cas5/Csc1 n=1 Tax=uncultured Microscilla sp. TaxID=432653 RepID=UPI00261ECC42|nr:type I-D CRISPR-associated protein Cas5/Csc1 [uncultured Microscilla sp.]
MYIQPIKLTLLNHLFYYTEVSGGSSSAAITGNFIGDLALSYAFRRMLQPVTGSYEYRKQPHYGEIKDFGFYCTVAPPMAVQRTENYIQNTLFNVDGFYDADRIEKSGKSPFKNFRQVQGLAAKSTFTAVFLSATPQALPPAIRIGTGRNTLVQVETHPPNAEVWLNAFTLKTVFGNLDKAQSLLLRENKLNFQYVLENYALIKQLSLTEVKEIFEEVFAHA